MTYGLDVSWDSDMDCATWGRRHRRVTGVLPYYMGEERTPTSVTLASVSPPPCSTPVTST